MSQDSSDQSDALDGPILSTFLKYLLPSLVGLIAMTSASLVDGIFIGNFIGVTALAAVNLIIPIMTLLFGVGVMLSIGGSVRGGKYLGEKNVSAASAIFSKTLISVTLYGVVVIALGLIFESQLFAGLGATEELFPVMSEYYRIIMPFLITQLITIVLYFFIRLDGYPNLTAAALAVGSVINIALDYLFIAVFEWGLAGAAFATGISQSVPMLVLMIYFIKPDRKMRIGLRQKNWMEVFQAAYNGISEFINEISGGLIALLFNWMLIQRAGVEGVAAITVVNYLLMVGFMVFFAISDSGQVMISQNFGAKRADRIRAFLKVAASLTLFLSLSFAAILLTLSEPLIYLFVDDSNQSTSTVELAVEFASYVWPVFLVAGINMLFSGYLTAVHLPFQSGVVALCRSLLLPAGFLTLFYFLLPGNLFVLALTVAEGITFALALTLFISHRPEKVIAMANTE